MFLCLTEPITNLPNVLRMDALYHENHHIVALFVADEQPVMPLHWARSAKPRT